jgi:hypothetical protein
MLERLAPVAWLHAPHRELVGDAPLDALRTGHGEQVLALVLGIGAAGR